MSLKQHINHFQVLLNQGVDLFLLRLRMLQLDVSDQAAAVVRIFAAVVLMGALFVFGMISLLLGLNHVLSGEAKIWVFFGLAVCSLLAIAALASWSVSSWKNKNAQVAATLRAMQQDIACLRGMAAQDKEEKTDERQA
ncbi:phage holin family protein [Neisseria sp.]|uniref:phage holin family protein n=1 Tax=Neisseria sp. TaxID=192066 RepID=UPI0026DCDB9D|nr:phage holin family protein [Neisseria sp.]MDO4907394.1 phage holin family protein [Neisseria sp.]